MKTLNLVIEIEGGVLQGVYGDEMPQGYKLNIILRDMDNIEAGDKDPVNPDLRTTYDTAEEYYF
jgi:hypothetical protein